MGTQQFDVFPCDHLLKLPDLAPHCDVIPDGNRVVVSAMLAPRVSVPEIEDLGTAVRSAALPCRQSANHGQES
jgi:hypothetical protein